jgi:hypothetical protein
MMIAMKQTIKSKKIAATILNNIIGLPASSDARITAPPAWCSGARQRLNLFPEFPFFLTLRAELRLAAPFPDVTTG